MTDAGGRWATVTLADGATRRDWVPDRQPPPPGEGQGRWHIVRDEPEAPSRWEWHPAAVASPPAESAATAKAVPLRWSLTAAVAGAAMVLTYVGITVFGGGSDNPAETVASEAVTDRPLSTNTGDRDDDAASGSTDEAARPTGSVTSTGSALRGAQDASTPRPSPTTWAQEVLTAGPDDPIRLTPVASDWSAENIVVGKDGAGKFLGRVTVRYAGPGTAQGRFAVTLVKDGEEITTLTGELVEVRSGIYQVMVFSAAAWVEGPWTTQFAVVSTS